MPNEYTRHWFDVFLETMPAELTRLEVDALATRLPRPEFARILDICCGPARHATDLVERGYDVTGIDRDAAAIAGASQRCPTGRFIEYANGATETMQFELFTPEEIDQRARLVGLQVIETCCWWDSGRKPSAEEQRFQVTFERV